MRIFSPRLAEHKTGARSGRLVSMKFVNWSSDQFRQQFLKIIAQHLHQSCLDIGAFTIFQHAGDGNRHPSQRKYVCSSTADQSSFLWCRCGAHSSNELDQHTHGRKKSLRTTALIGQLTGHLLPAIAGRANDALGGHENIFKHHFVEVLATCDVADRPDLHSIGP